MKPELNKIYCGDALEVLKTWPDEFVDLIITSPPYYGLRKYGDYKEQIGLEPTFAEYMKKILKITAELKRVLKPSGQLWWNMGDCYGTAHISGTTDKEKGWKQDKGISKNEDRGRAFGIEKSLLMMPERIAMKMIDEQGWILRNRICWAKQILDFKKKKTEGGVMPSSVQDRFNESWEYLYFFTKNKKYWSDLDAVRLPNQVLGITDFRASGLVRSSELYPNSKYNHAENQGKIDGRARKHISFNYRVRDAKRKDGQPQFKASDEEIKRYNEVPKDYGKKKLIGNEDKKLGNRWMSGTPNFVKQMGKNLPTCWLIGSEPHNFQKELQVNTDHFATFPQALCKIPIKFGCPEKGLVLDPFMGSGTTALVARQLGRNYLGIELNSAYIKLAEKRLTQQILL